MTARKRDRIDLTDDERRGHAAERRDDEDRERRRAAGDLPDQDNDQPEQTFDTP
jgi:hypothetical protein